MEARAEHSQWQVELRCKDKDKEGFEKIHPSIEQAESDLHGDDRRTEGGQQFQRQRREEGDPQNAQGGVAELVADRLNIFRVRPGLTEQFQSGQSLQAVEEVGGEARERLILLFGDDLGALADHDHEERDQRRSDEHDDSRKKIDWKDDDQMLNGMRAVITNWGRY